MFTISKKEREVPKC